MLPHQLRAMPEAMATGTDTTGEDMEAMATDILQVDMAPEDKGCDAPGRSGVGQIRSLLAWQDNCLQRTGKGMA